MDKIEMITAKLRATEVAAYAYAAYWAESKEREDYFILQINHEFTELAAALGYRVEKIEADEVAG